MQTNVMAGLLLRCLTVVYLGLATQKFETVILLWGRVAFHHVILLAMKNPPKRTIRVANKSTRILVIYGKYCLLITM